MVFYWLLWCCFFQAAVCRTTAPKAIFPDDAKWCKLQSGVANSGKCRTHSQRPGKSGTAAKEAASVQESAIVAGNGSGTGQTKSSNWAGAGSTAGIPESIAVSASDLLNRYGKTEPCHDLGRTKRILSGQHLSDTGNGISECENDCKTHCSMADQLGKKVRTSDEVQNFFLYLVGVFMPVQIENVLWTLFKLPKRLVVWMLE